MMERYWRPPGTKIEPLKMRTTFRLRADQNNGCRGVRPYIHP